MRFIYQFLQPIDAMFWVLTPGNAVLAIWLDIRTIQVQLGVQRKECLNSDSVSISQLGTRIVVDVAIRAGRVAAVDLTGLDVSSADYVSDVGSGSGNGTGSGSSGVRSGCGSSHGTTKIGL